MKTKLNDRPAIFNELQRFRQPWLWAIILAPMAFLIAALFYPEVMDSDAGQEPVPLIVILIFNLVMGSVVVGFARAGLTTMVDDEGMTYGWSIFGSGRNRIEWSEIASLSLIRYKFVGYGIRMSWSYGVVHNVSGRIGLLIHTKRGKKFMIGTNRPEELDKAIRKVAEKHPHIDYTNDLNGGESSQPSSGLPPAQSPSYT